MGCTSSSGTPTKAAPGHQHRGFSSFRSKENKRESCGGYKSSTPFLLEWAWHWAGEHLLNIRHLKRDWRAQSQQDQWYPTLWPQPHFWGPLMWRHLNCQFSGAEDVASFRLAHGLYETAAWRQDSAISLNREQDFFLLPIRFLGWCPSPSGPIHTSLEWGLYQPPYWQEFLVLWILHNKKKVSLWPKILFKKNCGNNSHTTNGRVKRWKPVETRSAFSHLLEVVLTQLWRRTQNSTDYVRALRLVS